MPFAPAVLEEVASDYFIIENKNFASQFMTIVCSVTSRCQKECKAIVHLDNTARPQIVSRKSNPQFWKILNEYLNITGGCIEGVTVIRI